jgi:archaetidylinositol phosphate synthase
MTPTLAQADARQTPHPFRDATRVLRSLTATTERRLLVWLAGRLPRAIHADHLTALAALAILGAGASYAWARTTRTGLVLAVLCLALNWFGDSLDGTVARVRHQQRPRYGFYVDHVVDAMGACALLGGLALSGYMHVVVALLLLVSYLLVSVETFLATYSVGTFTLTYFGFGPTELRLLLAAGNLVALRHPIVQLGGHGFLLFDVGACCGIAGLLFVFLRSAVEHTVALSRAEPRPPAADIR